MHELPLPDDEVGVYCVVCPQDLAADRFYVTIYSHLHVTFAHQTILFAVCSVLLVTIKSRELWLPRSPDEPVRFLMVGHVKG
jgi:hypothetical protein